jgi:RNA polymerase sigma factor (sigma-70 family)
VRGSWSAAGTHQGRALFQAGRLGDLSDAELIKRSVSAKEEPMIAETAFAALVERHGPMVYRICRTTLGDHHEAEDAFQATFLVLVRDARRLRVCDSLAPWLYEVARRVSLFARSARLRRRRHEQAAAMMASAGQTAGLGDQSEVEQHEFALAIQAEVARLPDRFRSCVILCDLEGLSYAQAARQLGVPVGTVQSRLARARKRLRQSLARRGLGPQHASRDGVSSFAILRAGTKLPARMLERTPRLCLHLAAHHSSTSASIPASIASLVKGESRIMLPSPIKLGAVAALFLVSCGLAVYSQTGKLNQFEPAQVKPSAQTPANRGFDPLTAIVPPREMSAASGRGKILVYELDQNAERILAKPEVYKETPLETSWVVVTGSASRSLIHDNLRRLRAGMEPSRNAFYRRVDLQRQERQADGSWSSWTIVDPEPTLRILDNVPEEDEELTPDQFRLETLCDPLPHLTEGQWRGVNVGRFVPPREYRIDVSVPLDLSRNRIPRPEPAELMLRQFDFSVERGQTYRYRARLVVLAHPPGRRAGELAGAWSEPTPPVVVP